MKVIETPLKGLLVIEPRVFGDKRGFFLETFQMERYREAGVTDLSFVQDNVSRSAKNVLRGMHFQIKHPQGKLVYVTRGEVFDAAVDVRPESPTFGQWFGAVLSDENHLQLYVPPGFAHGFCVMSDIADFTYKCTDYYNPEDEGGLVWNDPDIGIEWPVKDPVLVEKDNNYPVLKELSADALPQAAQ